MSGKNVTVPGEEGPGNHTQGWIQSDKDAHKAMWQLGVKHPSALAVLHFMISKLNRGAGGIAISAPALARAMNISERTAKSAVSVLRDSRFVQILKSGNTNIYIVNSKVAWQGRRGARYASFNAQLIIDEQEQVRDLDDLIKEADALLEVPVMELEMDPDAEDERIIDQDMPEPAPKRITIEKSKRDRPKIAKTPPPAQRGLLDDE
jgi:hypothetical protein